jgi:hypothetical protein
MINAQKELIDHIKQRDVKYIDIRVESGYDVALYIQGTLIEVLPELNFEYDDGFGSQKIYGCIWYSDGTWSNRGEYDGSEWWQHHVCPPLPKSYNP